MRAVIYFLGATAFGLLALYVLEEKIKLEEIRTFNGKTYQRCKVVKVGIEEIQITHSSGKAVIPTFELPQEIRDKVGITDLEMKLKGEEDRITVKKLAKGVGVGLYFAASVWIFISLFRDD